MIDFCTQDGYQIQIPSSFHGYCFHKLLGRGSTSIVLLVENEKTQERYSAKIMSKTDLINRNMYDATLREINVQKSISHQNIIKYKESFELRNDKDDEFIIIIMEYCENGDLLNYVKNHGLKSETILKKINTGFLKGVKYLHSKEISHGDIKAENILLDSNLNAKLCDFGFCRTRTRGGDEHKNGTMFYSAPELFRLGQFDTLKTDIYAIGITLYTLSELKFPFDMGSDEFIIRQIVSGRLSFSKNLNKELLNLIKKCTEYDPNRRPTIDAILNDEYFGNQKKLESIINNQIKNKHLSSQVQQDKFLRKWNNYQSYGYEFESSDSDF